GCSSSATMKVTVITKQTIAYEVIWCMEFRRMGSRTVTGTFADPDTSETHTVTITWGDGSPDTVLNLAAGVLTIPATTHQYLDNLPSNAAYTVTVVVADAKANATGTTNVTVNNVAPAISGVSGQS